MNKLQLSLLVVGAVVILAVVAFNRWQERKYRRQTEARFPARHEDVLLNQRAAATREEPVLEDFSPAESEPEPSLLEELPPDEPDIAHEFDDKAEPIEEPRLMAEPAPEPETLKPAPAEESPSPVPAAKEPGQAPDPETEYVVTFNAADPISAHALVLVLQQLQSAGKPVRWLGQGVHWQTWSDVFEDEPAAEYVKLAACLQLADRNGPVLAQELAAFNSLAQAVAANLYAVVDCPDKDAALARAEKLDQFCADVDVLIGINVISKDGGTFAGTKLRALAESAGMKLMADGNFHYINDQGAELFSLTNQEPNPFAADTMKHLSTHGVTFLFDVPKAAGGLRAYNQMMMAVKQFVAPLGALVVDDNRRELTDSGIDKIRQQLVAIYQRMDGYGIGAGSSRARRLFA